jgi:hypothetical protein
MSLQQHMPDQAVLAKSWTLFCPECSQKMRIVMAAPSPNGRETRTYECLSGHREWMTVALPRGAGNPPRRDPPVVILLPDATDGT